MGNAEASYIEGESVDPSLGGGFVGMSRGNDEDAGNAAEIAPHTAQV